MSDDRQTDSDYPQSEAEKRRDDLLKRLLHTPPKQRPKREREQAPKKERAPD